MQLMLISLIHFNFNFVQHDKYDYLILLHGDIQFDSHYWLKISLSVPVCIYGFFLNQNSGVHRCMNLICAFSLITLISMSDFTPVPCCFYYCSSVVQFEIRNDENTSSSLLLTIVLAIQRVLYFHMKLRVVLLKSVKNCVGTFTGIALNHWF